MAMTDEQLKELRKTRTRLSIREVVRVTNLSDSTLRRYCRMGVCTPEVDDLKRRLFSWGDIKRIKKYKASGLKDRRRILGM